MTSLKKPKPPPLVLSNPNAQYWPVLSPLAEFAAIATSPESPLVKKMSCDYESSSSVFKLPSLEHVTSDFTTHNDSRSFTLPSAMLWERIQEYSATFAGDSGGTATQDNREEYPAFRRYKWDVKSTMTTSARFRPHNLKEKEVKRESRFDEIPPTYTPWSKYDVKDAANSPRPPCRELQLDDVTRNQSFFDNSTKVERPSALFDLDSAAQALSNMAKRKEERVEYQRRIDSTLQIVKRKGKRTRKTKNTNSNARRPMNAFMLFAKRYRLEITQKHPGKDNRAISVILGDEWRSLSSEARKVYIMEAKTLAEEHKRIYPDCWKRKRTQMSSRGNRKH